MRTDLLRQAEAMLAALLAGGGAGLLYDLLRPARWRGRALAALLADTLFCLLTGAAFFLLAMSFGEGRLGIAALAAAWTGFLAYHRLLSARLLPFFVKAFQILDVIPGKVKKFAKKISFLKKSTFKNEKNAL